MNVYIRWCQQKPDQPLKCILYTSSNENVVREQGVDEERYEARKNRGSCQGDSGHTDAGLDYCACWDTLCGNAPRPPPNKSPPSAPQPCKHIHAPFSPPEGPGYCLYQTFLLHLCPQQGLSSEPKHPICDVSFT